MNTYQLPLHFDNQEKPQPSPCLMLQTPKSGEYITPIHKNSSTMNAANSSHRMQVIDLAIVGGGASGLATAIQIIERIKRGYRNICAIRIIEKRSVIGPGLAYGDASAGLIVNMHSATMGLRPDDPLHFSKWMRETTSNSQKIPFPSRQQYGKYLQNLAQSVIEDSKKLGIDFSVINQEVLDMKRASTELGFELTMETGDTLHARDVVLALGNFCATSHLELSGNPRYSPCPWPAEKLEAIDRNADVLVLGSRLTAIDVANALVDNGHLGTITFISRSGKIPKVQGTPSRFSEQYALENLATELEQNPNLPFGQLETLVSTVKELIQKYDPEAIPGLSRDDGALETLRNDIVKARRGLIPWQAVICATTPLVERYWNTFTVDMKKQWLNEYNSTWVTHRHAMPLENAKKILALLERGQLRVVKGSKVLWNEERHLFVAQPNSSNERVKPYVEGDYFIEALGQEFDTSKMDSPLLKQLLASGLLEPHPVCGIEVDFETLKTATGIYAIGSLTKGVHFYVTATDRITAHASRIADSLVNNRIR